MGCSKLVLRLTIIRQYRIREGARLLVKKKKDGVKNHAFDMLEVLTGISYRRGRGRTPSAVDLQDLTWYMCKP